MLLNKQEKGLGKPPYFVPKIEIGNKTSHQEKKGSNLLLNYEAMRPDCSIKLAPSKRVVGLAKYPREKLIAEQRKAAQTEKIQNFCHFRKVKWVTAEESAYGAATH